MYGADIIKFIILSRYSNYPILNYYTLIGSNWSCDLQYLIILLYFKVELSLNSKILLRYWRHSQWDDWMVTIFGLSELGPFLSVRSLSMQLKHFMAKGIEPQFICTMSRLDHLAIQSPSQICSLLRHWHCVPTSIYCPRDTNF